MTSHDQQETDLGAAQQRTPYDVISSSRPFMLLAAMLAHIVIAPLIGNQFMQLGIFLAIVLASVNLAADNRRHLVASLGLAIPGATLAVIADVTGNIDYDWASYPFLLLLYLQVVRLMLTRIFKAREVTLDIVGLALCIYVMLGIVWVLFYTPVVALDPDSFMFNTPAGSAQDDGVMVYFSYVTLTTLGYGDVVPVSPLARGLAVLEAITGVLFLAVLISQLVGKYSVRSKGKELRRASRGD